MNLLSSMLAIDRAVYGDNTEPEILNLLSSIIIPIHCSVDSKHAAQQIREFSDSVSSSHTSRSIASMLLSKFATFLARYHPHTPLGR